MKITTLLLAGFLLLGSTTSLMGQKVLCYKNNIKTNIVNKDINLNGKACNNNLSANAMVKQGWKLDDIKIVSNNKTYNHIYIFSKEKQIVEKNNFKVISKLIQYDLNEQQTNISKVTNTNATINIGNLKIGQSGIIVHKDENNSFIISRAVVTKSDKNNSKITFNFKSLLNQNAIPTTTLKPQNNDTFILNHLYNTSLLIVPNLTSKKAVNHIYPKHIFLEEDFFASQLKINNTPIPTKEDIQQFALSQQLGTIFIVADRTLYILDTLSMKVINKINLNISKQKAQVPFFTNISDIKKPFWNYFGDSKIKDYDSYYKTILEL